MQRFLVSAETMQGSARLGVPQPNGMGTPACRDVLAISRDGRENHGLFAWLAATMLKSSDNLLGLDVDNCRFAVYILKHQVPSITTEVAPNGNSLGRSPTRSRPVLTSQTLIRRFSSSQYSPHPSKE